MSQTDLIAIPTPQTALQVFTTEDGMAPLIARIRERAAEFSADVSTAKGRAEIKSFAFSITKAKTELEAVGKRLAAEQKVTSDKIDACRRRMRAILGALADEVRQPLTDYEDAEKARVARHRGEIARLDGLPATAHTVAEIDAAIADLEAFVIGADLDGFAAEYAIAKDTALRDLRSTPASSTLRSTASRRPRTGRASTRRRTGPWKRAPHHDPASLLGAKAGSRASDVVALRPRRHPPEPPPPALMNAAAAQPLSRGSPFSRALIRPVPPDGHLVTPQRASMRRVRLALTAILLAAIVPQAQADGPMTFPQVIDRNAEYRATWKAITTEIRPGDKEGRFLRVLNGPATQMLATNMAGKHLLVGFVCEIHNCDANSVTVVIEPSTSRMWAVQRRRIDVPLRYRFFGQPDRTMQAVLVRQAELGDLPLEERLKH